MEGDIAGLQALVNSLSNVRGNALAESLNILAIESLREAKSSVDDSTVQAEEVLGNLGGTRVLGVQGCNEGGGLTLGVKLVVDGAHGENGTLELLKVSADFGVVACFNKAIFEDIAKLDFALNDGKEFGSARVDVW